VGITTRAQNLAEDARLAKEAIAAHIENAPFGEKSKELARTAARYESLGNVGWGLFPVTPIIERGEGSLLYDADGKRYIDLISGFSVSGLGNCNPEVTKIIAEQAGTLTHFFDFPHPQRIKLAQRLSELSGIEGPSRVLFGTTGSDGIESAVKAARYYTGKPYILVARGDYHGASYGTISLTSRKGMNANYAVGGTANDVGYFGFPHLYREGLDTFASPGLESLKELEDSLSGTFFPYADGHGNLVAAILVEPFQSSSGYYIPPREYLQGLREICDRHDILLIIDEVQTGLGRTGKLWGYEHSGIRPDAIVVSKTLGGGLPLSALIAKEELLSAWAPTAHINTQAGNAVASAAANYILDTLTSPGFLDEVNARGDYFKAGLDRIAAKHPTLDYIDHTGLYLGLEFVLDTATKEPAVDLVADIRAAGLREGLFLDQGGYYGNRIPLIPALNIPYELIDEALEILDKVIGEAEAKAGF
jgi:4-aminobutyrate aminotransferase-like enzyme